MISHKISKTSINTKSQFFVSNHSKDKWWFYTLSTPCTPDVVSTSTINVELIVNATGIQWTSSIKVLVTDMIEGLS